MPYTLAAATAMPLAYKAAAALGAYGAGRYLRPRTAKKYKGKSRTKTLTRRSAVLKKSSQAGWTNAIRRNFIPTYKEIDFTYSISAVLTSSTTILTTGAEHEYKLNSCFNPASTFGSHQPRNWDQAAALWARYKVFAVTIQLRYNSDATTDIMHGISAIVASGDGFQVEAKPVYQTREVMGTDERVMAPNGQMTWLVQQKLFIKNIEGNGKEFSDAEYSAAVAENPVSIPKLRLACATASSAVATELKYDLTLTYHTRMYERVAQASS